MKNRKWIALCSAVMLVSASAGVSYAYLTDSKTAENVFDIASAEISIEEDFNPPDDPKPGTTFRKAPRIKNEAKRECFVRVRIIMTNDGERFCEPLSVTEGWEAGDDDFYYWKTALPPGEVTAPLFENVTLAETIDGELEPFDIDLYAEAVCTGTQSLQDAWELKGGS